MQFLANENIPLPSVRRLRDAGHDVVAVAEEFPGSTGGEVLARAVQEGRVILTFDRDYGALVYQHRSPPPVGVIYFRFEPVYPEEPAVELLSLLATHDVTVRGRFTVLERGQTRQRPLP